MSSQKRVYFYLYFYYISSLYSKSITPK